MVKKSQARFARRARQTILLFQGLKTHKYDSLPWARNRSVTCVTALPSFLLYLSLRAVDGSAQ
ncbi:MAG: hypothetical protein CMI63_01660 [Parvularcula sp.]|nr:hypothetical protein [Parvularcula sp.]